jgi:DNA-binding XRE family transcriptional regulator
MKEKNIRNLPRVLKVNSVAAGVICVVFNNGARHRVRLATVLRNTHVEPAMMRKILNPKNMSTIDIVDGALSFPRVRQAIQFGNKKMDVPFDIGADILYQYSEPEPTKETLNIGSLIHDARKKAKLSQQELAKRSGTTRTYISKIENNRSDLEMETLKKVVEVGLGRKLEVKIR